MCDMQLNIPTFWCILSHRSPYLGRGWYTLDTNHAVKNLEAGILRAKIPYSGARIEGVDAAIWHYKNCSEFANPEGIDSRLSKLHACNALLRESNLQPSPFGLSDW